VKYDVSLLLYVLSPKSFHALSNVN